jgi:hypothetical protein
MLKETGFVVAVGNPFDGISLFGSFDDASEANEWADHNLKNVDWWVMATLDPASH